MIEDRIKETLDSLAAGGNLRRIPSEEPATGIVDITTNDYLGLSERRDLIEDFYEHATAAELAPTAAASRLLASSQRVFEGLEEELSRLYGRSSLLLNSGYHANSGIIPAIASPKNTVILADRLVHASIIDGIKLSGARFERFPHNDYARLQKLLEKYHGTVDEMLVIVESVYSMDGDSADIDRLLELKRSYPEVILYVDEAHAFGVAGRDGLGLVASSMAPEEVDIVIGTLGKAAASSGAFAITGESMRNYLVNRCRSLIFSTAIAPVNAAWSRYVVSRIPYMTLERERLARISAEVARATGSEASHIQPVIVGDSARALEMSRQLLKRGVKVLPIRTPTVPPGTERLRVSLSASLTDSDVETIVKAFETLSPTGVNP